MLALSGHGQGVIVSANTTDTRILDWRTGEPVEPGIYTIGLYAGAAGSSESQLTLIATTGINPLSFLKGVFNHGTVALPGISGPAAVQIKAWENEYATYEDAVYHGDLCVGKSPVLSVPAVLGLALPGDIVADGGFAGFYVCVPEPSSLILSLLGVFGGLIFLYGRKH